MSILLICKSVLTYELTCRRFQLLLIINQKNIVLRLSLGFFAEGDQVERWLGGPMEHKKRIGREETRIFHASIGGRCPLEGRPGLSTLHIPVRSLFCLFFAEGWEF